MNTVGYTGHRFRESLVRTAARKGMALPEHQHVGQRSASEEITQPRPHLEVNPTDST